jgi:SecD/SecF fusion protein
MSRWDSIALSNLFMHKTEQHRHYAVGFMTLLTIALPLLCVVQPACGKGVEYVIAVQKYSGEANDTLEHTAQFLSRRLTSLGIAGRVLVTTNNALLVRVVGVGLNESDETALARTLQRTGSLTVRHVHPDSDILTKQGITEPGYQVMEELRQRAGGEITTNKLLVAQTAANGLTSERILRGAVTRNPYGKPELAFEFDREGAVAFAQLTRDLQPRGGKRQRLAIVIDDRLYSAPYIDEPITSGRVRLTGNFTEREAFEMANIMENPLGVSLTVLEKRSLSPTEETQLAANDDSNIVIWVVLLGLIAITIVVVLVYRATKASRSAVGG